MQFSKKQRDGHDHAHKKRKHPTKIQRAMKLSVVLLIAGIIQVRAGGYAQTITLSGKNLSVKEVFEAVRKQTGYQVFTNKDFLDAAKPVSVNAQHLALKEFMDLVAKEQPFTYQLNKKTISLVWSGQPVKTPAAPVITVAGRILDKDEKPLPGATVRVRNGKAGISTSEKGYFSLSNVPENAILDISAVGFEPASLRLENGRFVLMPGKSKASLIDGAPAALVIKLSDHVSDLNELKVTAFGIEKSNKEIGYSLATVKGEEIQKANAPNILAGLAGRVSGLNVATQSPDVNPQMKVLLRGIRSFSSSSNNQPLFVLNGSALSFGSDQESASLVLDFVNNINPNDIEDVTVLKGANATALYGPQGVNGVIIITTKKGQKGKPLVSFRSAAGFQRFDYRAEKYKQRSFGSGTGQFDANGVGIYSATTNNGWGPKYDGSLKQLGRVDENGNKQMVPYQDVKDDRRFYNVSQSYSNNLSVSQGDANSDFYLGLSDRSLSGVLPGDKKNMVNTTITGGRKLGFAEVRYNVNYYWQNTNTGPENFGPSGPVFVPFRQYKDYNNYEWADNNHYWSDADVMSPYQRIANDRKTTVENAALIGLGFIVKPLPWLTVRDNPQVVLRNTYSKHTVAPVNFSDWAKMNGGFFRRSDIQAALDEGNLTVAGKNNVLLLTAVNKAGDFDFRSIAGNEITETTYKLVSGNSTGLVIPVYNLSYSTQPPYAAERYLLARNYSYFATSTIGYKKKVFLELTARNDWDSKRAKVGRGKDLYVGGNTSVLLKDMIPALTKLSWLDALRLRAAVNTTANMNIEPYQSARTLQTTNNFPYSGNGYGVPGYSYLPGNPNPDLLPEKVLSVESGFAAAFFQNKVELDFAYYWQRNNGVIMNVNNAWLSMAPTIDNLGVLNNKGWELDLKFNAIVSTKNFNLNAGFRIANNTNKVISMSPVYNGLFSLALPGANGRFGLVARTGHQAFEYQVYDFQRDPATGKVIVDKNSGAPLVSATPTYTGNTTPKYIGGFNVGATWKKWSVSTLGEFNIGAQHYFTGGENLTKAGMHVFTTYNDRKSFVFPNSVYNDGTGKYVDNTSVQVAAPNSIYYNSYSRASALFLTNANFLKFREFTLSYETALNTRTIKKINVGIYGRNLLNFYNKQNIYGDPQLVKGPGRYTAQLAVVGNGVDPSNPSSNVSGSSSDQQIPAGLVEYGAILTVNF